MTQSDTGTTLVKLRKMIESMQKEEICDKVYDRYTRIQLQTYLTF